jgi:hypothetical protein
MKALFAVVRGQFLIFVRNRLDFFLTMGFPLVLVFLFGFIWAAPEGSVKLGAVLNGPREPVLQALAIFRSFQCRNLLRLMSLSKV